MLHHSVWNMFLVFDFNSRRSQYSLGKVQPSKMNLAEILRIFKFFGAWGFCEVGFQKTDFLEWAEVIRFSLKSTCET